MITNLMKKYKINISNYPFALLLSIFFGALVAALCNSSTVDNKPFFTSPENYMFLALIYFIISIFTYVLFGFLGDIFETSFGGFLNWMIPAQIILFLTYEANQIKINWIIILITIIILMEVFFILETLLFKRKEKISLLYILGRKLVNLIEVIVIFPVILFVKYLSILIYNNFKYIAKSIGYLVLALLIIVAIIVLIYVYLWLNGIIYKRKIEKIPLYIEEQKKKKKVKKNGLKKQKVNIKHNRQTRRTK